jgi:hypothetical protein
MFEPSVCTLFIFKTFVEREKYVVYSRDTSLSLDSVGNQGTFREYSVNIQPTFTARGAPQYAHVALPDLCIWLPLLRAGAPKYFRSFRMHEKGLTK